MNLRLSVILLVLILCSFQGMAQKTDTLIKKLDELHKTDEEKGNKPVNDVNKIDYTAQTNITFKGYFVLLGTDLVQEVTGPFHASGKSWIRVGEFALIEAGLALSERNIQRSSVDFMTRNPGLKNTSTYITNFGALYEVYTLAAFGAYGLVFKSNKVKTTTLLATQAYLTGGAMESVLKFLTGRQRPYITPVNDGVFMGPFLNGKLNPSAGASSFPSGHTTVAFAAATVFAQEYKDELLIPIIAYSAASLVGVSRITENKHWATDVFAGAALGYVTGKQVVNNYHRYARLRSGRESDKEKRTSVHFNLQYSDGILMPGMVCKF